MLHWEPIYNSIYSVDVCLKIAIDHNIQSEFVLRNLYNSICSERPMNTDSIRQLDFSGYGINGND